MPVKTFFTKLLGLLGLWKESRKLLFFGLDNAGKTTLLYMLKHDRMAQLLPTHFPGSIEFSMENMSLTTFDFGGQPHHRHLWTDYFIIADGVVFLIDVDDSTRFPEAKKALDYLLADENLEKCPVLILGNKMDRPGAVCENYVRFYFALENTTGKEHIPRSRISSRPLELFMCSVLNRQGYDEAFRWLAQYLD